MWKRLTMIGAFATALAAAPAFAQQPPTQETQPPAATEQQPGSSQQPQGGQADQMSDLVGLNVMSSDGERLGAVAKVEQDADGTTQAIHFTIGSTLGIGGKTVKATADQFTQTEEGIKLSMTAEAAEALPEVREE